MATDRRRLLDFQGHVVRLMTFALLSGCLAPINVDVENAQGLVVVSGQVSNLPGQSVVQLGFTADTDRLPFPASGATVRIVDETTGEEIPCFEPDGESGLYRPTDYAGVPGHAYHVEVVFEDRGQYRSASEVMPPSPGTLEAHYDFKDLEYADLEGVISQQPFIFIYVNAQLPDVSEPMYLRWTVDEVILLSPTDFPDPFGSIPPPCFVAQNADPQRVTLFDGSKTPTKAFENLNVAQRIVDWTFLEKHAFTIYQSSLTPTAHDYWSKVDILANQTGSIFDTPPAALRGNIQSERDGERTFGYFQAVAQSYTRFFTYKFDIPFPLNVTDCLYYGTRTTYPTRCLDCTTIRNSSYNRPDWF